MAVYDIRPSNIALCVCLECTQSPALFRKFSHFFHGLVLAIAVKIKARQPTLLLGSCLLGLVSLTIRSISFRRTDSQSRIPEITKESGVLGAIRDYLQSLTNHS